MNSATLTTGGGESFFAAAAAFLTGRASRNSLHAPKMSCSTIMVDGNVGSLPTRRVLNLVIFLDISSASRPFAHPGLWGLCKSEKALSNREMQEERSEKEYP